MTKYEKYCKLRDEKKLRDANVAQATGIGKSTFFCHRFCHGICHGDGIKNSTFFTKPLDYSLRI